MARTNFGSRIIIYVPIAMGFVYLAAILDVWSRPVIGVTTAVRSAVVTIDRLGAVTASPLYSKFASSGTVIGRVATCQKAAPLHHSAAIPPPTRFRHRRAPLGFRWFLATLAYMLVSVEAAEPTDSWRESCAADGERWLTRTGN